MGTCQNSRNIRNLICDLQKELVKNKIDDNIDIQNIFDDIFTELDELEDIRDCNCD